MVGSKDRNLNEEVQNRGNRGQSCFNQIKDMKIGLELLSLRPKKSASVVNVPYSLSNRSINGVNAKALRTA